VHFSSILSVLMKRPMNSKAGVVTGLAALAALATVSPALPGPARSAAEPERVRGVVISTHTSGREWGWDEIGSTLDDIREVGAGWIATHPYARIGADGSIRFHEFDANDPPAYLVRPIREAHARGLKIAIHPHLAYWGSPFSWRGEIAFETDLEWTRFFEDYERWIVKVAAACREADGYVIGNELDLTLGHEAEWRRIIRRVRAVTPAALSYAANWPEYQRVPFWDALDAIGIQAYFPLSELPAPSDSVLEAAWHVRLAELRAFATAHNRKVVFTELGYNRSFQAAQFPWDDRSDGPEAEPFQELCLRTALRCIENEPAIAGVFLWKWFPNPHPVGRNFQLATPRLKRAIADSWRAARPRSGK